MLGAPGQKFGAKAGRRARVTQVQDGCAVALALLRIRLSAACGFLRGRQEHSEHDPADERRAPDQGVRTPPVPRLDYAKTGEEQGRKKEGTRRINGSASAPFSHREKVPRRGG